MTTTLTSAEILTRAADLIDHVGLHKGDYWRGASTGEPYNPGCPCCTIGALAVVTGITCLATDSDDEWSGGIDPTLVSLVLFINRDRSSTRTKFIDAWNDMSGQTAVRVAATLRACAAELQGHTA